VTAVAVPLRVGRRTVGHLILETLPKGGTAPEDRHDDPTRSRLEAPVRLVEEAIYRYTFDVEAQRVQPEPAELFDPDADAGLTGRLWTQQAVGRVIVRVDVHGSEAEAHLDVRPRKLGDERAFRAMLTDLATVAVEVLHQAFSASGGAYSSVPSGRPRLLYQQFAILHAQLFSEEMELAIARVLHQPYRTWHTTSELRPVGMGVKGTSRLAQALATGGRRAVLQAAPHLPSLPIHVPVERSEETLDNLPNRYLRFVLERWRSVAIAALAATEALGGATRRRGSIECQRVVDHLDGLLSEPLFREVGRLSTAPQGNQVLLKRDGYRQITAMAALVETALGLDLDLEDPFIVQRRSIATLYELWCFASLAQAVGAACGEDRSAQLFDVGDHGMSLAFRQGPRSELRWTVDRLGRRLQVSLFFNRTFDGSGASWTRRMRPDCSLLVRPDPGSWYRQTADCWIHFDAKYRVDSATPFAEADDDGEDEVSAKRADLLRMHAYRDAIRASAGSYVLYPGATSSIFPFAAAERLPAIGALPLRPQHRELDVAALEAFVDDLLDHVATQTTRHERARFWTDRAYADARDVPPLDAAPPLVRPPADSRVLVNPVRPSVLPLEAGGTPLVEPLLILGDEDGRAALYERTGPWVLRGHEIIAPLRRVDAPAWLSSLAVPTGDAQVTSWVDLALAAADGQAG
jgi:predicted component of viral defense system (DUF524 family)